MNCVIPNLGTFQSYRDILLQNRETARFITDNNTWDFGEPTVQSLVRLLLNKAENPTDYMKMAFEFVNQKIQYFINNRRDPASVALKTLKGDCSEYSDLFVALLRGGGIPAKVVHGVIIDNAKNRIEPHAWCEYFSPELGWIQCDPTWGYLAGVCCQHISRQREGLEIDLPTYSVSFTSTDSKLIVNEQVEFQIIPKEN
jgi:transglutaminase-like putative cysteine protease